MSLKIIPGVQTLADSQTSSLQSYLIEDIIPITSMDLHGMADAEHTMDVVFEKFRRYEIVSTIQPKHFYLTLDAANVAYQKTTGGKQKKPK